MMSGGWGERSIEKYGFLPFPFTRPPSLPWTVLPRVTSTVMPLTLIDVQVPFLNL